MKELRRYVGLRFSVVPCEDNLFTHPATDEKKLGWFREIFFKNNDAVTEYGTHYAIRGIERIDNVAFGKLSKKRITELHEKDAQDIHNRPVEDWPYVDFVCDSSAGKQYVILRFKSEVVSKTETIARVLSEIANQEMWKHGYSVQLNPILDDVTFWKAIENAEGLYRLKFSLASPNLFGANQSAHDALTALRNIFHNTTTKIALENDHGKLTVPKDEVEPYRDYADKGCGTWELVVKKNKRKKVIKSQERAVKISVEVDDTEEGKSALKKAIERFRPLL